MNKQAKYKNGELTGRGIEWTDYTSNPVKGCQHRCRWTMPDGSVAICYAEAVAEGVAQAAYPDGFAYHYWNPEELASWARLKTPAFIFWDSMADLFGHWVPAEQIQAVLDAARQAHWHIFQSLTKNVARVLNFDIPPNVWPGSSMPPDSFMGNDLTRHQQGRKLSKDLSVLSQLAQMGHVTWMSFEPLSWDVSPLVAEYPHALRWAVIGAASNGKTYYQPDPVHVQRLLEVLDRQEVKVFFKGNLRPSLGVAFSEWREELPQFLDGQNKTPGVTNV